jgi:hypothetical protein
VLLDDLDRDAAMLAPRRGAHDRAQRARDPALPADHLAHVVGRDAEQERELSLALLDLDPDGVGLVDQPPGELFQELSRCRCL